jgi:thiamine biosynthesis lipoprotein
MGMPIVLDIQNGKEAILEAVFKRFQEIDERFSTYKEDSEVSRFRRGELEENDLSRELKSIIRKCRDAEVATEGHFSATASGQFDPSGYVKGWAIAEAVKIIKKDHSTFCIYAGGDIYGQSDGERIWRVAIQNPLEAKFIIASLSFKNLAVATSGTSERGQHIFDPRSAKPVGHLLSVTVVGPDIIDADVLATAAFVVGEYAINFVAQRKPYEALAVTLDGQILMTPGMSQLLD